MLARRLANWEFVKEIRAAPDRVAGQGVALKLRTGGGDDLVLVCFYAPPTSGNRKKMRTQTAASVEVM